MKKIEIEKYNNIIITVIIAVLLLCSTISSVDIIEKSKISVKEEPLISLGNYQSDELLVRIKNVDNGASGFEYDTVNIQVFLETESGEIGVQSEVTFPEAYGILGNKQKTKSTDGDGKVSFVAGGVDGNENQLDFDITARKTTESGEVIQGSHNGFILENRQLEVVLSSEVNERDNPVVKVLDHKNQRVMADLHFNGEIISVSKIGETRINIIPDLLEGEEDYPGCGYVSFNNIYASKRYYKNSEPVILKVYNLNFPPYMPIEIDVPDTSIVGYEQTYSFSSKDGDGNNVDFYVDWGDGSLNDWDGPYESEETVSFKHTYMQIGTYTIKVKTRDIHGEVSIFNEISTLITNNAPDKPVFNYDNSELKEGKTGSIDHPYCFTISTSDIDGDVHRLEYGWDWNNDGTVDIWDDNNGKYYGINEVVSIEKSFNNGVYDISVRSRDCFGAASDWSDSIQIIIGNQIPDKPYTPQECSRNIDGGEYIIKFEGTTFDINGDKLTYKFRFEGNDENSESDWFETPNGGYDPGQYVSMSNRYSSVGKYYVYIKACDLDDEGNRKSESEWSEPYVFRIWIPPKSDNYECSVDADACMPMKIDIKPNINPVKTYEMIHKSLSVPETSIRAFVDDTYGIYNEGILVKDNLKTTSEIVDYLINAPGTPDEENADSDDQQSTEDDPDETDETPTQPLTAHISCDSSGVVGESISFQGSFTGGSNQNMYSMVFGSSTEQTTYSYHWDFDDGSTKNGKSVYHSFSSTGTYTVELTVTLGTGESDKAYKDVTISSDNSNPVMYSNLFDTSDTIEKDEKDLVLDDIIKPVDVEVQFDATGSIYLIDEENKDTDFSEDDFKSDLSDEASVQKDIDTDLSSDDEIPDGKNDDLVNDEEQTSDAESQDEERDSDIDKLKDRLILANDDDPESLKDIIIKFLVEKIVEKLPFLGNLPAFSQYLDEEEQTTMTSSSLTDDIETKPSDEPSESTIDNDLSSILDKESITPIWIFGDGEYAVGWRLTHSYHIDPSKYIDEKAEKIIDDNQDISDNELDSILKTRTYIDPALPPKEKESDVESISESNDESDEISNDDSVLLKSLCVSYDVTLLLVEDPDRLITNENIDRIDIADFKILGIDTTSVTIDISDDHDSNEILPVTPITEDINDIDDEPVKEDSTIIKEKLSLSIF